MIERLQRAPRPLLDGARLTAAGADVLAGRLDHVALNGVDRWVGGVRLSGRSVRWRWDEALERVVQTAASSSSSAAPRSAPSASASGSESASA
jgi:hypothetical protein